jgi:hypothetical protein
MDRLTISPLRGLTDFSFSLGCNIFIPSGLKNRPDSLLSKICKKINKCSLEMLNRNQENMPATYHFGLKVFFEGYLINKKLLCDGYVMDCANNQPN